MNETANKEIDLRQLYKKFLLKSYHLKKYFLYLFFIIMGLSIIYFSKVVLNPKCISSTLIKTTFVTKNQLESYADYFNETIVNNYKNNTLPNDLVQDLIDNKVVKIDFNQEKPDITDPNKNNLYNYYTFNLTYGSFPNTKNENTVNNIINYLKIEESKQNYIIEGKLNVQNSINEVDSLISVAFIAGKEFKDKLNNNSGSMLIVSDIYKSVNDIITTKKNLETELFSYKTENLIYQVSPTVIKNKIKYPIVVLFIGFFVWIFICIAWVFLLIVFEDEN